MKIDTTAETLLSDLLPPMSYRDLATALEQVAASEIHKDMVPHLVSALRRQAPFLTGQMALFEILRSGNCLADVPVGSLDS